MRQGEHSNTAFGLALVLDYTRAPEVLGPASTYIDSTLEIKLLWFCLLHQVEDAALEERILGNATSFYLADRFQNSVFHNIFAKITSVNTL